MLIRYLIEYFIIKCFYLYIVLLYRILKRTGLDRFCGFVEGDLLSAIVNRH